MSKASNQRNSNGFDDNLPVVYKNYNAQYNQKGAENKHQPQRNSILGYSGTLSKQHQQQPRPQQPLHLLTSAEKLPDSGSRGYSNEKSPNTAVSYLNTNTADRTAVGPPGEQTMNTTLNRTFMTNSDQKGSQNSRLMNLKGMNEHHSAINERNFSLTGSKNDPLRERS